MESKFVVFCVQICLIKTVVSQCFGANPAAIAESLGLLGAASAGPAGGPLLLQNYPMPTTGLSIVSDDLIIDGLVSVSGRLPFLGTVALEGVLPTAGQGSVMYGCGNGEVGIVGEGPIGGFGPAPGPGYPGPAFGGPIGPGFGPISPAFGPISPAFPYPCNQIAAPQIDPGMAAAANTAALAAAANSAGQAAVLTSYGIGAAAHAAGLTAMAGL
ncbi:uncharacterized protein [Epargyreus clarus]|uniref:uncharacterized protein n=1 Tax=Epargyreus clarus TaxID=520877 RepID=UPI003C305A45